MLKKLRIVLAAVFFIGITLLFLNLAGVLQPWLGWMAKIQFLPAVMGLNLAVILGLVLLTLVFGRVYCSVICPMGVFQDIVSRLSSLRKGKALRFGWKKELKVLRYGVWVLYVVAIMAGVHAFVVLLAPYSAYGRMIQALMAPTHLFALSAVSALVAILTFVVITALSWAGGRTWCNTVCPVGTTLSFFSRFALLRPVLDETKCRNCHLCERKCKASCIDVANHRIDCSRCVVCFDCIDNCSHGAISYRFAYGRKDAKENAPDGGRRAFMAAGAALAGGVAAKKVAVTAASVAAAAGVASAQGKKIDGGLAEILPKQNPERKLPLVPFGAGSLKHFHDRCTACQLCVSACPNNVLSPSSSLEYLMQPEMNYGKGYCRPECTACSQVCPSGAILPLTQEEKTAVHIGVAVVDYDLCLVNRDGVSCGNCARHCPAGAIIMVRKDPSDERSAMIPAVNEARCIGCGACEYLCPSRPLSAIHVDGRDVHIVD